MITPNDIETKVFSSSLRGYSKKEVDEFLDQVMIDYQALMDQNAKMLERVHVLQKQVAEAKDPARMTQDAKRLMNDISASAEQKAEVIIKNAKHDAENIVRNARNSTTQADEDAERLRRKVEKFKLRFKQLLEEEIERVNDNSEDLLDDLRQDFYPTMLYGEKEQDATITAGGAPEAEDPIASLPDVEPTADIVEETDQSPDGSETASETQDAPEDESLNEYEEEYEEAGGAEGSPADEAFAEAEEETDATSYTEAEELPPEEAPSDVAEVSPAEADAEAPASEQSGAPSETLVIDRSALDKALREQTAQEGPEGPAEAELVEAPTEGAGVPEGPEGGSSDRTLILERPEEILESAVKYGEYDDPDRTEAAIEPEPETEEEQASKYADYAAKFMNVFKKKDE